MAEELLQGTLAKSRALQGLVIRPIVFLVFIDLNDLPGVTSVLLFNDGVKLVAQRSQFGNLQSPLYNAWEWSVKLELIINPAK